MQIKLSGIIICQPSMLKFFTLFTFFYTYYDIKEEKKA